MSAYNGNAALLRASIESILDQEGIDLEFIIVDDGSTDCTRQILADYAERDARIHLIKQANSGLTEALIRGCLATRGEFVARQDADDRSFPRRLAAQAKLLAADAATGFVSCWTEYVGPGGEPMELVKRPVDSATATRKLLDECQGPPAHGSVMFRRDLYMEAGGYRAAFYYAQDSDLWLRMAERAPIAYVPEVLYQCRRDMNSISGAAHSWQKQFGRLGQLCRAARREGRSELEFLQEAAALTARIQQERRAGVFRQSEGSTEMAYIIGSMLIRNGDDRGRRYLWSIVKSQPWHWRAWIRLVQSCCNGRGRTNEP